MFRVAWIIKRIGAVGLALLVSITFPILIWVAAVFSFTRIFREWRVLKGYVPDSSLACRLDGDCPPGHVCIRGRCLPDGAA